MTSFERRLQALEAHYLAPPDDQAAERASMLRCFDGVGTQIDMAAHLGNAPVEYLRTLLMPAAELVCASRSIGRNFPGMAALAYNPDERVPRAVLEQLYLWRIRATETVREAEARTAGTTEDYHPADHDLHRLFAAMALFALGPDGLRARRALWQRYDGGWRLTPAALHASATTYISHADERTCWNEDEGRLIWTREALLTKVPVEGKYAYWYSTIAATIRLCRWQEWSAPVRTGQNPSQQV